MSSVSNNFARRYNGLSADIGVMDAIGNIGRRVIFWTFFVFQTFAALGTLFLSAYCIISGFRIFSGFSQDNDRFLQILGLDKITLRLSSDTLTVTTNNVIMIGALYFIIALALVFMFFKYNTIKLK